MKVDIIAEIGINHNGSLEKALHMIDEVAATGVRVCKFQHYDSLKLLGKDSPYLAYATSCQFSKYDHEILKRHCDFVGLEYLVSIFDINDIPWADGICKRHKVASRMNTNSEFIAALISTGKEVLISTQSVAPTPLPSVRYMYCVTKYPTALEELRYLPCGPNLGLSSHCPSIAPSLKAVTQGATILENHVTFNRELPGCDQSSSITYQELKQMVKIVRDMEAMYVKTARI